MDLCRAEEPGETPPGTHRAPSGGGSPVRPCLCQSGALPVAFQQSRLATVSCARACSWCSSAGMQACTDLLHQSPASKRCIMCACASFHQQSPDKACPICAYKIRHVQVKDGAKQAREHRAATAPKSSAQRPPANVAELMDRAEDEDSPLQAPSSSESWDDSASVALQR